MFSRFNVFGGKIKDILFKNKRLKITDHTYNASPVSMSATIKSFSAINKANKIFIIGINLNIVNIF